MAKPYKKSAVSSASSNKKPASKFNWLGLVIILAIVAVVPVYVHHSNKNKNDTSTTTSSANNSGSSTSNNTASNGTGMLSVDPGSQSVSNGSVITVSLYEDSNADAVNAVQTNLTYPTDKFDLVKIDTSGSAFAIKAQEDSGGGSIKIARGTINPVTGKQLVAKVQLKAKVSSGSGQLQFANGSGIVRSSDNKEILQDTNGGTYTFTQ